MRKEITYQEAAFDLIFVVCGRMQIELVKVAQLARHQLHVFCQSGRILQLGQQSLHSLVIVLWFCDFLLIVQSGILLFGLTAISILAAF